MPNNTYVALATQTVGTATPTVTFSSIPSGYTDLVVVVNGGLSSTNQSFRFQVGNGTIDTGNNYSYTYMAGNGSSASSSRVANTSGFNAYHVAGQSDANIKNNVILHYQNYSNTTTNKTILCRGNSDLEAATTVAVWRNTAAINTILVGTTNGNLVAGTTISIYGISNTVTVPTSPIPITANLHSRFDASNLASITSTDGLVSQWNDISGNNRNALALAFQPSTGLTTQNGLNVLNFNNQVMIAPASITSNSFTYFFVGSKTNAGTASHTYSRWMSLWNSGGTDYDNLNSIISSYTTTTQGGWTPSTWAYRNNSTIIAKSHTYGLANLSVLRLSGSTVTQIHNGGSATGSTSATSLNVDRLSIGGAASGVADSFLNGWVGEIVVYNTALSDADITTVSNWLKAKWNTV